MKTSFNLPDAVVAALRSRAKQERRSMSACLELLLAGVLPLNASAPPSIASSGMAGLPPPRPMDPAVFATLLAASKNAPVAHSASGEEDEEMFVLGDKD
jgi:hypothetical protein